MQPSPPTLLRSALAALAALVVAIGVVACSPASEGADPPPGPDGGAEAPAPSAQEAAEGATRLTVGLDAQVVDLNPLTHVWSAAEEEVARTALETLTTHGAHGPVPYLAASLVADETSTNWTIGLPSGVQLHDGTPLDATLVKDCLELMGASATHGAALAPMTGVEVTSELELVVNASGPWPQFDDLMATQVGAIASPEWLRSGEGTDPIGTGPFRITGWDPPHQVTAQRLADHRTGPLDRTIPVVDEIAFVPVLDEGARAARLEAGLIDVSFTSDPVQIQRALSTLEPTEPSPMRTPNELGVVTALHLNTEAPPFSDPLSRQALTLATDPAGIREELFSNVDPDLLATPSSNQPALGRGEADRLAEELATASGAPLSFGLLVPEDLQMLDVAKALRQQWAAVGIEARLVVANPTTLAAHMALGDFQAALVDKPTDPGVSIAAVSPDSGAPATAPVFNPTREIPGRLDIALYRSPVVYMIGDPAVVSMVRPLRWWERGS